MGGLVEGPAGCHRAEVLTAAAAKRDAEQDAERDASRGGGKARRGSGDERRTAPRTGGLTANEKARRARTEAGLRLKRKARTPSIKFEGNGQQIGSSGVQVIVLVASTGPEQLRHLSAEWGSHSDYNK